MKSKGNIDVIVLGGHVQGLGIVRAFAKKGMRVVVIDDTDFNLAKYSRYCVEFIKCQNSQLKELLFALKLNSDYKRSVVFPTNDFHVKLLSQSKEELNPHLICAVDHWRKIEVFFSKALSYELASSLSIEIAKTIQITYIDDLSKIAVKFPCIIKPTVMHTFYARFKKKVIVCADFNELNNAMKLANSFFPLQELLIQEVIKGDGSCQYSVGVFAIEGEIIRSIIANRARQHPIDFGNATTMAITCDNSEILDISRKIMAQTKYTGICEIEFKQDEVSGEFNFLEVNSRTWKWHSICQAANVDLLGPYYEYLTKGEKKFDTQKQTSAYFIHHLTDLPTRLRMRFKGINVVIPPRDYQKQNAVWDRTDQLPWFMEKIFLPYFLIKR